MDSTLPLHDYGPTHPGGVNRAVVGVGPGEREGDREGGAIVKQLARPGVKLGRTGGHGQRCDGMGRGRVLVYPHYRIVDADNNGNRGRLEVEALVGPYISRDEHSNLGYRRWTLRYR